MAPGISKIVVQITLALKYFAFGMISFNSFASDGYAPPSSFLENIQTYTVKHDGSYTAVNELTRIIETEEGVSTYGEVDIPYLPGLESVVIQDAYTILPSGLRIMVPRKNIRTTNDALDKGGSTYSDRKHRIIIYPNVVVGSQLYYKYTKIVHKPIFHGQFAVIKFASPHFKQAHTEININFDPRIDIKIDSKGFIGGQLPDNNGMHRFSFTFRQEGFAEQETDQISISDYAPYVAASSFSSYVELGHAYQEKAIKQVNISSAIKKLADDLTNGVNEKKEQARILHNWVSRYIRYVGSYIGNGGYVPHDSQTILDNRWGDCKDHVVILEALLAAKGIDSSPALINTADSYLLPALPELVFDHVITYIPSLDLYLDSTSQFAPFGTLPAEDLDKPVVLTSLNHLGKTPPMLAREQKLISKIWLKVLPDGSVQGRSSAVPTGFFEIHLRNFWFLSQSQSVEQVTSGILSRAGLSGVGQTNSGDPSALDKPFEISSTFTLDPVSNVPGPAAMPIPVGLTLGAMSRDMFSKPKDRIKFPTHCDSFTFSDHYDIEFPSSINITHVPENVDYKDENVRYTATYVLKGNKLEIVRDLVLQYATMTCGDESNEMDKRFFPVFKRDMRAQIIYQ